MKIKKLKWSQSQPDFWTAIAPAVGKRYSIGLENGIYYSIWTGGLELPGNTNINVIKDAAQKDFESVINEALEQE